MKDPERIRQSSRRWRAANLERARALDRARQRRYRAADPDKSREAKRREQDKLKASVLDHYGRVCACCGSTKRLTIDHVDDDGAQHRDQVGGGWGIYRWIIANGFPPGFQVLCRPCNASKGKGPRCTLDHSGGERTHKRCSECGELKPLSEFHRKQAAPDGLAYQCKPCACARKRAESRARRNASADMLSEVA